MATLLTTPEWLTCACLAATAAVDSRQKPIAPAPAGLAWWPGGLRRPKPTVGVTRSGEGEEEEEDGLDEAATVASTSAQAAEHAPSASSNIEPVAYVGEDSITAAPAPLLFFSLSQAPKSDSR